MQGRKRRWSKSLNEVPNRPEAAAETLEQPIKCIVPSPEKKRKKAKKNIIKGSKTFPLLCVLQKAPNVEKKRGK